MNAADTASQLISTIQALTPLLAALVRGIMRGGFLQPAYSYENISLSLTLDILDVKGNTAILQRRQSVRFLSREAGVITNPVTGEGRTMAGYEVNGAVLLHARREGSRRVLLLGMPERPNRNSHARVVSERRILGGFRRPREYFDAAVERPTRRLYLRATFPKGRPPHEAALVHGTGRIETLTPRLNSAGRAVLSWSQQSLKAGSHYSLRWSW